MMLEMFPHADDASRQIQPISARGAPADPVSAASAGSTMPYFDLEIRQLICIDLTHLIFIYVACHLTRYVLLHIPCL